jgi:hypothetical protein
MRVASSSAKVATAAGSPPTPLDIAEIRVHPWFVIETFSHVPVFLSHPPKFVFIRGKTCHAVAERRWEFRHWLDSCICLSRIPRQGVIPEKFEPS